MVLKDLNNHEIAGESGLAVRTANPFNEDIHALASTLLDYSKVVTTPMDFLIIQKKLDLDQYKSFEEFATDIRLVFSNCLAYNHQTSAFEIRAMANTLSHYFETVVSAITGRPRHVVATKWVVRLFGWGGVEQEQTFWTRKLEVMRWCVCCGNRNSSKHWVARKGTVQKQTVENKCKQEEELFNFSSSRCTLPCPVLVTQPHLCLSKVYNGTRGNIFFMCVRSMHGYTF